MNKINLLRPHYLMVLHKDVALQREVRKLYSQVKHSLWKQYRHNTTYSRICTTKHHILQHINQSAHVSHPLVGHNVNHTYIATPYETNHPRRFLTSGHKYEIQDDIFMEDYANSKSCLEFLDLLAPKLYNIGIDNLGNVWHHIVKLHYNDLLRITWLHQNYHIAHIQLTLQEELEAAMQPIWQNQTSHHVLEITRKLYKDIDTPSLVRTFLSLLYLNFDRFDPLCAELYGRCKENVDDMDFHTLMLMACITRSLNSSRAVPDWLVPRYKALMDDPDITWTADKVKDTFMIINLLDPLISSNLMSKYMEKLSEVLDKVTLGPYGVGVVLRYTKRIRTHHVCPTSTTKVTGKMFERSLETIAEMKSHDIAEICNGLKTNQIYHGSVQSQILMHSYEMLLDYGEDIRLADLTSLMYALHSHAPPHITKKFLYILNQKLRDQDIDIIVLSNLADHFINITPMYLHRGIQRKLQMLICKNTDKIFPYSTRHFRLMRLMQKSRMIDPKIEAMFAEKLLKWIEEMEASQISKNFLSTSASYLLSKTNASASLDKFINILTKSLHSWSIPELCSLADGLNRHPRTTSAAHPHHISHLTTVLNQCAHKKMDNIKDLLQWQHLCTQLVVNNPNRDAALTHDLVKMAPKYCDRLSDSILGRLISVFNQLVYYSPEVFDKIAKFIPNNPSRMEVKCTKEFYFLNTLGKVGYLPQNTEEYLASVLRLYQSYEERDSYREMLHILGFLGNLEVFPTEQLQHLFSLPVLESIDAYMHSASVGERATMMTWMMINNRNIVIECPELDIPWFHESYCQQQKDQGLRNEIQIPSRKTVQKDAHSLRELFSNEVDRCLRELLGADNYEVNAISPYFFHLDFVVHLDEKKCAIEKEATWNNTPLNPHTEKIAVLVQGESAYCFDSGHLTGSQQIKIRQLQMLGYKVVQVPHFDWFSMGMTDWQARLDYMQDKLFNK